MLQFLAVAAILVSTAHGQGCPEKKGVQTYPNEEYCDQFYKCEDGVLTEEKCENGLAYDGHGHIHNYCNYNWAVDCGKRKYDDTPISSPGCLYQYGLYPVGQGCQTTFFQCAAGVAYEKPCLRGQAYDYENHQCNYPDLVYDCKGQSESVVGFKCPTNKELPSNAVARRFLPFPRFPDPTDKNAYIVCVDSNPRVQFCGEGSFFREQILTCDYPEEHFDYPVASGPPLPIHF